MKFTRRTMALALAAVPAVARARRPAPRVQFWATYRGGETLDSADSPGNPFAAALIETMAGAARDLREASAALRQRTIVLSGGRMAPEAEGLETAPSWRFASASRERRVALVLTIDDYRVATAACPPAPPGAPVCIPSLPGVRLDGARVAQAFRAAGFDTLQVQNATRATLAGELDRFAARTRAADVAAVYATGHGVQADGVQYVLYGDHVVANGTAELARAARWSDIAGAARAKKLNLTFWAGCRNNPFA